MQQLTFVLYEMDEALRNIEGGRLEQLRLALLLLDNAAELQIGRRVRQERQSEDLVERIRERTRALRAARGVKTSDPADRAPLSATEKRRIDRSFDAKLAYLAERHGVLDPRLAKVLSYVHRYRNEAYHEGRVRRETIRTAALILFEANCQLLLTVFRVVVHSSADDYSWLGERFGIERPGALLGSNLQPLVDDLRSRALPTLDSVVETLSDHLQSRIDDLREALDFITDNADLGDPSDGLKLAQIDPSEPFDVRRWPEILEHVAARWSVNDIDQLESDIESVGTATERLEAFAAFSQLEERLELIEEPVHRTAGEIDTVIQLEVDRLRGK